MMKLVLIRHGESVWNLEKDVYKRQIHYLYEFSCGPLSGWMYLVNGKTTNLGCSNYPLKDGDYVEWVYTCDLGKDIEKE